jgi:hypothetical protein
VAGEHQEVVRIHQALLRTGAQEVLGVPDDELVERGAGRHEDGDGARAPPRPAQLLPGGGDGAWIADDHRRLKGADVDAQLESVRADDPPDLA